jgi:hypothetical protein
MDNPDMEALKAALLKVEGNRPDSLGICTVWHRNPEGPQAWGVIEASQARNAELEAEALEQARLLGMSAEREMANLARIAQLEGELAAAHTRLIDCDLILQTNVRAGARNDADEQRAIVANRKYFRALKASAHD